MKSLVKETVTCPAWWQVRGRIVGLANAPVSSSALMTPPCLSWLAMRAACSSSSSSSLSGVNIVHFSGPFSGPIMAPMSSSEGIPTAISHQLHLLHNKPGQRPRGRRTLAVCVVPHRHECLHGGVEEAREAQVHGAAALLPVRPPRFGPRRNAQASDVTLRRAQRARVSATRPPGKTGRMNRDVSGVGGGLLNFLGFSVQEKHFFHQGMMPAADLPLAAGQPSVAIGIDGKALFFQVGRAVRDIPVLRRRYASSARPSSCAADGTMQRQSSEPRCALFDALERRCHHDDSSALGMRRG